MTKPFVDVVVVATGRKQRVPAHFVGDPILGVGIRLTPAERARQEKLERPPADAPIEDLRDFADAVGVVRDDLPKGDKGRPELLQRIENLDEAPPVLEADPVAALPTDPDDETVDEDPITTDPASDETPATGGQE